MARGRKKKEQVQKTIRLKPSELKQAITDASRHKAEASEWSGRQGQVEGVKLFCERTSFDRTAFGWLRKLNDMDSIKRDHLIRTFLMGVLLMEFSVQKDLFDDVESMIENTVAKEAAEDDDPRPAFLKNAMPLDEAEKAFETANRKVAKPDALSDLAGDAAPVH